ncbi:MAG TPA: hypothetical protein DEH78_19130 [Solibacterales bacterium]|nr:hypothetical protein [Bryobacterales bacterium]
MYGGPAAALASLAAASLPLLACYSVGRFLLRTSVGVPRVVALAVGAPVVSFAVFLLLLADLASPWSLGAVALAALLLWPLGRWKPEPVAADRWILAAAAPFAFYYLIHALAPEIQPDGITYHLGIVKEWLRTGGFGERVTFYEILPLGMETLFAIAYGLGGGPAAKLTHFAFLLAAFPLICATGARLGLSARSASIAAALYFTAPVAAVSGTSTYTDAGLVFFALAAFHLLLTGGPSGWAAGFCYAIKLTGAVVPLAAFWPARRKIWFAAAAAVSIVPWLARALAWTGNPVAPLLNAVFPNPSFAPQTAEIWSYDLHWWRAPLELTLFGEKLNGALGPAFLGAPVALWALRRRQGQWLLGAALLLALPWAANPGTRFLLPALPFVALAIALVLPWRFAVVLLAIQMAGAALIDRPAAWRLRGLPWAAALGIESPFDYLRRELWAFEVTELVNAHVKPGEQLLDLVTAPWAYLNATPVVPWQSAAGERLKAALELGAGSQRLSQLRLEWPETKLTGLRLVHRGAGGPWNLHAVELARAHETIRLKRGWELDASPNPWESPYALDRNPATRWTTWVPAEDGDFWQVLFPSDETLTAVTVTCHGRPLIELLGRVAGGKWRRLGGGFVEQPAPELNLRSAAARYLKSQGIRWILTPAGTDGYGPLGEKLIDRKQDWGFTEAGTARNNVLLRVD